MEANGHRELYSSSNFVGCAGPQTFDEGVGVVMRDLGVSNGYTIRTYIKFDLNDLLTKKHIRLLTFDETSEEGLYLVPQKTNIMGLKVLVGVNLALFSDTHGEQFDVRVANYAVGATDRKFLDVFTELVVFRTTAGIFRVYVDGVSAFRTGQNSDGDYVFAAGAPAVTFFQDDNGTGGTYGLGAHAGGQIESLEVWQYKIGYGTLAGIPVNLASSLCTDYMATNICPGVLEGDQCQINSYLCCAEGLDCLESPALQIPCFPRQDFCRVLESLQLLPHNKRGHRQSSGDILKEVPMLRLSPKTKRLEGKVEPVHSHKSFIKCYPT